MLTDFFISVQWWFVLFLLGICFYPLTAALFKSFIDKGYALSKSVGILILTYCMLVLGTIHLLTFSFISLMIVLVVCTALFYWFMRRRLNFSFQIYKDNFVWIVIEEILFVMIFAIWTYIRSFAPDINGLEKFMDFGFVNSILRTDYFPPKDMWFTPLSINYYYFGHLVTAVLTKLSLLQSSYTYNLMIATIAGLTFVSGFSLAINLYTKITNHPRFLKLIFAGILSASLITFSGNLHTLYMFFTPYENEHPVPPWELSFSPQTFPNSYWYPNATRFIYHTIHEFPIYSWTVSDLHGHVTDIPFVLLTLAFFYSILLSTPEKKTKAGINKKTLSMRTFYHSISQNIPLPLVTMLSISLLLAVMYMTNAWDGLIYLLLAVFFIGYLSWKTVKSKKQPLVRKIFKVITALAIPTAFLGIAFFIFSIPFSLFFKPFVSGVGVLCAPKVLTDLGHIGPLLFEPDHCQKTPFWQLGVLYGFFYFFVLCLALALKKTKKLITSDIFVIMLIILATLLIIVPEFLYAKDIYPAHYRANTMFKLVFQSFILLSLSVGYSISRVTFILKSYKTLSSKAIHAIFFAVTLLLLLLVFIYPYFAVLSYYGELKTYKGLNGTAYLKERLPADWPAINWLNTHVKNQPVILEAQGDSYTDFARVSANTGLPTVLGWTVHEWLWRGSYDIPAPRIDEVKNMYESTDTAETKRLLKKYNVSYVFVGELERQKYTLSEEKFEKLGKSVFHNSDTTIYQLD